ncbi:Hypothetical predicted protein [Paramuricea clavata]|uniref:Uncharacterized protein n=1 Tax=Paramuricea clavata TaxID=317549 RepID=A0A7D9EQS6_PARCT|nr:Hypothetical predicted protein [Paramuricea clavata]
MMRILLYFTLACVAFTFTEGIGIKEVFVINVNASETKVIEETITFNTDDGKSSSKTGSDSGIVEVKYVHRKPTPSTRPLSVIDVKGEKTRKHHRHLRKRCCNAGELAGKHGLSCLIPRNFGRAFFNLVTPTRQKYQGTVSDSERGRFRSKIIYRIYHRIKVCVKRSKKSVVQKCCLGYKSKARRRQWG